MIRAILDTNIILDALADRKPFSENAKQLFRMAEQDVYSGYLTANTITDIYYVGRRTMPEKTIRLHLSNLMKLFNVLPVEAIDCETALGSEITDYEDAILASIAAKWKISRIITRDEKFLMECDLTAKPSDFISGL